MIQGKIDRPEPRAVPNQGWADPFLAPWVKTAHQWGGRPMARLSLLSRLVWKVSCWLAGLPATMQAGLAKNREA